MNDIAATQDVRIPLAVESGSRAWGFWSADSDYDVRFLFIRKEDGYVTLFPRRDVIETPLEDAFDVNGWDLAKALKLMMRGNSVLHEWLNSPIVYREERPLTDELRKIASAWRNRFADAQHYHGLLSSQWGRFIAHREVVKLKKYFYVIRPAMALQWLRERAGSPPMDLPSLRAGLSLPDETNDALEHLQAEKQSSQELSSGPRIAALDEYVQEQARWGLSQKSNALPADPQLVTRTDDFFRRSVRQSGPPA